MMELNNDQLPTAHLFHLAELTDTKTNYIIAAADDKLQIEINIHFYGIGVNISKWKQTG